MADRASEAARIAAEWRDALRQQEAAVVEAMLDTWQMVQADLRQEFERFLAGLDANHPLTEGQLLRMSRMQSLLAQVDRELGRFGRAAGPLVGAGQQLAAEQGRRMALEMLRGLGVSFDRLPIGAVENVTALARAGYPLEALLEPMYGAAATGVMRELVNGLAAGRGPRQIARRMAVDGLTDGLNHLLLVTRDQYNRAHRLAALEVYRRSGVVTGYVRRCARQVGRTCVACIALDGQTYRLEAEFEEHPQGRCTLIPLVRGVNYDSLGNGQSWFESLSAEEQVATMGRGRWELWQAGQIGFGEMVTRSRDAVWGPAVWVTPLRALGSADARALLASRKRIVGSIVERVGRAYRDSPLRKAYEEEVRQLATIAAQLRRQGLDAEEIARRMHRERRDVGIRYKGATPEPLLEYIYELNRDRYKSVYGPTFKWLKDKGRATEDIITSSMRPNPNVDDLLTGFEAWLEAMDIEQLLGRFGKWLLEIEP